MASWRDNIRQVEPYVPGEQPKNTNVIKLNTNENPYGPSPRVKAVQDNEDLLRLYPDPTAGALVDALAEYHGVDASQVFVGVGSDDVLAMSFLTFFNSDKPILFPDITYSFYDVWAELFRIPYKQMPLDENFRLKIDDYMGENGGIVFPNPNAPTGIYESLDHVEEIIKNNPDVIVIVDEAYVDFCGESALYLTKEYDNVLIVQTFSKSRSMAGMRIGYAMGNPELIKAMNDVRFSYNSYPMTRLSVALGVAAIEDEDYFQATKNQIIETREWTKKELKALGFTFGDSKTNFIFAKHSTVDAEVIFDKLREKHIFVRHFSGERIRNYLRISIGTMAEMEKFIDELKKIV